MLSLFGENGQHDFCSQDEQENNDDLLSQISTSLSSSEETGPPVSDKLSKLVNDKFQTEYTVENVKRYYRSTKYKVIAMKYLCRKLTQRLIGRNLVQTLRGRTSGRTSLLQDTVLRKGIQCRYYHCE